MVTRRQFLTGMSTATVLGFNPLTRTWVTTAKAASSFDAAPLLDGEIVTDPALLIAYASDVGNIVHETPIAVLRPRSVTDVQKMVSFCRWRGIRVGARGQGHTTFGQSQVDAGLVVDMRTLAAIHSVSNSHADVDAGLTWRTLVETVVPQGLTPPVLTGYINLTIGGTLSVGGISSTNAQGSQVDRVRALQVVTGTGDVHWCSLHDKRDLFEVALAGLGQCGIITRAIVDLVPAQPLVRVYVIDYAEPAAFFKDLRTLLARGELNDLFNFGLSNEGGGWIYQLNAARFFDPASPPDDAHLFRKLSVQPSAASVSDVPYLEYVLRVDVVIDFFRQIGLWDGVQHPWFDVFLPETTAEGYVTDVTASLTPEDVGPTGFLLLFPQRRSKLRRPFLRVPESCDWVYLFDILTAAPVPGNDPEFVEQMLARNRRLFDKAARQGGTRYPIGALEFTRDDWRRHYGPRWFELVRLKHRYDPAGILTPGPTIF